MAHKLPNPDFWRGRRVFITGHTGFKGAWLSLWLNRLGGEVDGYALAPADADGVYPQAGIDGLVRSTVGDVRDAEALRRALSDAAPEIVVHLAAQALVRRAFREPVTTFETNVVGTLNLLEAARACPSVRAIVVITSDKVYDNQEWLWPYRESDRLDGREPYGSSKAAAEHVVSAYDQSYFRTATPPIGVASARAGNVIGGGDRAEDRLIPDFVRATEAGTALVVRNPKASRPWQHVLEPLTGYLLLAEALATAPEAFTGGWNFGPRADDCWAVDAVLTACQLSWPGAPAWRLATGAQPYEAHLLQVESSAAQIRLGWQPVWNVATAVERTIGWYREVHGGADARAAALADIEAYTRAAGRVAALAPPDASAAGGRVAG